MPPRVVLRVFLYCCCVAAALLTAFLLLAFHTPPPPVVHTDPSAAAQLNARLKQAQASASPASPQKLSVEQTELNSLLASYLGKAPNPNADDPVPFRDMKVTIVEDRLRLYVVLDFHGKDLALQVEGKLHTEKGLLRFEPLSGKVGALPIPRSALQSSMRKMMNSPEGREALRLPSNVSDVHVEDEKIVSTLGGQYAPSCLGPNI